MKMKKVFIGIFLSLLALGLRAQETKAIHFFGLTPSLTVEPYYEKGEFDLNVFPLIYATPITNWMDFRFASILNLGFRENSTRISHYGLQLALPIHFKAKEDKNTPSKGLFIAPGIGATRNPLELHSNFGIWAEPGYHLLVDEKNSISISFGLQFGATHFWYDNGESKWGNHFGVKIFVGFWR